ncbi:hypothetical protein SLITO_v1c09180 [Spiroplasma litorale]|uniref:Transmembrane protein n=1 Tax=Spiroplasma litorale TaxID=216942 RepID=A0A0K1W2G9_9MOLU|nr:hypothetical protein [Spiroplasma litorale]AKX34529.1 hypothetical protein SLITO_v1c09180 [Spiroplasma litorale]
MKKVDLINVIFYTLVSFFLILMVPFFSVDVQNNYSMKFDFSKDIQTIYGEYGYFKYIYSTLGGMYFFFGILSTFLKDNAKKTFSVLNILIAIASIGLVSASSLWDAYVSAWQRNFAIWSCISLLVISQAINITNLIVDSKISQVGAVQNSQPQQFVQQQFAESPQMGEEYVQSFNTVASVDPSDIVNKINNMRNGLSKPYEEAIKEIEQTGELSGIKIDKTLDNLAENNENKIIPVSVERNNTQQSTNKNLDDSTLMDFYDPLSFERTKEEFRSNESQSRPSTNYKYISRRVENDENKH